MSAADIYTQHAISCTLHQHRHSRSPTHTTHMYMHTQNTSGQCEVICQVRTAKPSQDCQTLLYISSRSKWSFIREGEEATSKVWYDIIMRDTPVYSLLWIRVTNSQKHLRCHIMFCVLCVLWCMLCAVCRMSCCVAVCCYVYRFSSNMECLSGRVSELQTVSKQVRDDCMYRHIILERHASVMQCHRMQGDEMLDVLGWFVYTPQIFQYHVWCKCQPVFFIIVHVIHMRMRLSCDSTWSPAILNNSPHSLT